MARLKQPIFGLCKFGKSEHMRLLIEEGVVFMRPLSAFVKEENDCLRGDAKEGLKWSLAAEGAKLQMEEAGEYKSVGTIVGPITHADPSLETVNVFCMFAFTSTSSPLVDSMNQGFGDAYVLFKDANEFRRRLMSAAVSLGQQFSEGLVEYVDLREHRGDMGLFRKKKEFAFQSEFRVALRPGVGQPLSLRLGSLKDIALIGNLANINAELSMYGDPGARALRHRYSK